jgi:hypothetical protein
MRFIVLAYRLALLGLILFASGRLAWSLAGGRFDEAAAMQFVAASVLWQFYRWSEARRAWRAYIDLAPLLGIVFAIALVPRADGRVLKDGLACISCPDFVGSSLVFIPYVLLLIHAGALLVGWGPPRWQSPILMTLGALAAFGQIGLLVLTPKLCLACLVSGMVAITYIGAAVHHEIPGRMGGRLATAAILFVSILGAVAKSRPEKATAPNGRLLVGRPISEILANGNSSGTGVFCLTTPGCGYCEQAVTFASDHRIPIRFLSPMAPGTPMDSQHFRLSEEYIYPTFLCVDRHGKIVRELRGLPRDLATFERDVRSHLTSTR